MPHSFIFWSLRSPASFPSFLRISESFYLVLYIQLIVGQLGFEQHRSTYPRFFFNKFSTRTFIL